MSNATGLIPSRTSAVPMADLYKEGGRHGRHHRVPEGLRGDPSADAGLRQHLA